MTKEDALTIKAVLLYIIKNSSEGRRDVYSIVKTAYYAQQLFRGARRKSAGSSNGKGWI